MMSSCCTLRLKRRKAFSRDSLSWMMTSATFLIHPQSGSDWYLAAPLAGQNCRQLCAAAGTAPGTDYRMYCPFLVGQGRQRLSVVVFPSFHRRRGRAPHSLSPPPAAPHTPPLPLCLLLTPHPLPSSHPTNPLSPPPLPPPEEQATDFKPPHPR